MSDLQIRYKRMILTAVAVILTKVSATITSTVLRANTSSKASSSMNSSPFSKNAKMWMLSRGGGAHDDSSSQYSQKLANALGDPEDDSSGADSDDSEEVSLTDSDFFYNEDLGEAAGHLVGLEDGGGDDDNSNDDDDDDYDGDVRNRSSEYSLSMEDGSVVVVDVDADADDVSDVVSSSSSSMDLDGTNVQSLLIREALGDVIYLPPSRSMKDVWAKKSNALQLDAESKRKLDRRSLYRALLLEIVSKSTGAVDNAEEAEDVPLRGPINGRRYINDDTLYKLKSAVSLASQPKWRQHFHSSKPSNVSGASQGISFFDRNGEMRGKLDEDESSSNVSHLATQSMQEIVTMALAHCYNCSFIILDDNILSTIRNNVDGVVKNSDVLRELFAFTNDNILIPNVNPLTKIDEDADIIDTEALAKPIVVFLRTDGCGNLLKSKTCVDILRDECLSESSRNLLVLGREPPFLLSPERSSSPITSQIRPSMNHRPQITNFAQPHVSGPNMPIGENDPEGSQRFNIFLVRLPNKDDAPVGHAKIMGILAPAEAGNLFPQIVANVGSETLDNLTKIAASNNTTLTYASTEIELEDKDTAAKEAALSQCMLVIMDQLISKIINGNVVGNNMADYVKDVLSNQVLRKGMADNLSRAAPAFLDPRCSGVMLSVFIPPIGQAKQISPNLPQGANSLDAAGPDSKKNWLNKILSSHRDEIMPTSSNANVDNNKPRVNQPQPRSPDVSTSKNLRNLQILQAQCKYVSLDVPKDPVRLKAWTNWIQREHSAIFRRRNKRALSSSLRSHKLKLSSMDDNLSQLLSSRDLTSGMDSIVQSAVEIEADKCLTSEIFYGDARTDTSNSASILLVHSESIIKSIKHLYPQTATTSSSNHHMSKEDLMNMAADKHERALVNNIIFPEQIGISYDQIGGLDKVKDLLRQSITYPLRYPHLYSEGIARESVKGVLLYGPPGTGKTLLAKAVATEGGATFLSVDPSSVENKWLGESEKNAKAVFTLARRLAPCVVYLDEVDSLLSSREHSDDSAHGTLTSVKTTMMSEWDGLNTNIAGNEEENHRVVVIGSTNRPFDLDEAVLRRFPRRILVDLPDLQTRKEILEVTLSENRLDPQVNLTAVAERLDGYTGSDIKEVCREAVVQISHEQARLLDQGDIVVGDIDVVLRPVNMTDFDEALSKLKRSVSERGRELARVYEWNEQYGEIKKKDKKGPQLMNMFL